MLSVTLLAPEGNPCGAATAGTRRLASSNNLAMGAWSPRSVPTGGAGSLVQPLSADGGRYVYVVAPAGGGCPSTIEVDVLDKLTMTWLPADRSAGPGNLGAIAGAVAWSGSEVIVWGGYGACGATSSYDGGGRYQPPAL